MPPFTGRNRIFISAHVASSHETRIVELPMLVAMSTHPAAFIHVEIFVFEPYRDAVALITPQLFHQAVLRFARPFATQEILDGLPPGKEFAAITPLGIFGVCQRDPLGVSTVPSVFRGLDLCSRR